MQNIFTYPLTPYKMRGGCYVLRPHIFKSKFAGNSCKVNCVPFMIHQHFFEACRWICCCCYLVGVVRHLDFNEWMFAPRTTNQQSCLLDICLLSLPLTFKQTSLNSCKPINCWYPCEEFENTNQKLCNIFYGINEKYAILGEIIGRKNHVNTHR